jgi:hypothetical protein
MLSTESTKFFDLKPFGLFFLVPRCRVIAALAFHALQRDDFSHSYLF